MTDVKFKKWDCTVAFAKYGNGRLAIQLMDAFTGEVIAVASVNLPDEPMEADEIAIKDYSENEGMLEALMKAKVVSAPLRYVESGWVSIPICHLNGVMPLSSGESK